jgi:NO-binding membrane sensor protein with MHYT domain
MAFILGFCAVWCMHFVGMQAEEMHNVHMCYNWPMTMGSLFLAVGFVWLGVAVAGWDIFAGNDRFETLKHLVSNDTALDLNQGKYHVVQLALFDMLHWITAGSILAAGGALSMHYVGMLAMIGPFRREWSFPYLAGSVVLGLVVCFVGFWILFRPLHWKVEKSWYRLASAAVIALAVNCLHFLGMLSVTYIYDSSQNVGACSVDAGNKWTPEQIQVLLVTMIVPFISFCVEHSISSELRVTYTKLSDLPLAGSAFDVDILSEIQEAKASKRSKTSGSMFAPLADEVKRTLEAGLFEDEEMGKDGVAWGPISPRASVNGSAIPGQDGTTAALDENSSATLSNSDDAEDTGRGSSSISASKVEKGGKGGHDDFTSD